MKKLVLAFLLSVLVISPLIQNDNTVSASSDADDAPIPKLKNQLTVPVIKFLICQS